MTEQPHLGDVFGEVVRDAYAVQTGIGPRPLAGGRVPRPVIEIIERDDGLINGAPAAHYLAPPAEWDVAWRIFEKCRPKGLMVRPLSHLIILSPPLVITRAQIDETVEVLKQGIKEVFDDLTREGFRPKA